MNARNKLILDRVIGRPLAFLLNLIVWPLGKIVSMDHDDSPGKVKTIAVAKFLGMGSILRATPLIRALRQKYPSARYIFVTTLKNKPLIENIPFFDKAFYVRDTSLTALLRDTVLLLINLWRLRVDLYFDLEVYSALSTIITTLSLARNRYGFYRGSTRFRSGLNTHLVYFNDHQHISKSYLQLARACGIKHMDYKIEKIKVQDKDKLELKNWLKKNNISEDSPYVVINPNASDLCLERCWPMDYFVLLINALAESRHNPIFIVGSPQERPFVASIWGRLSEQAKGAAFNLAGEVSLGAVIALIHKAALMITNDSGLYHIAESFKIPIISLWGPVSPAQYADIDDSNNFIFYSKEIYCSPCLHRTDFPSCGGNNACMKSISPKEVYKKACEILKQRPDADTSSMDRVFEKESGQDFDITIRSKAPKKRR